MNRFLLFAGLLLLGALGPQRAQGQAPAWQSAIAVASGSVAKVTASAADAAGNVYFTTSQLQYAPAQRGKYEIYRFRPAAR